MASKIQSDSEFGWSRSRATRKTRPFSRTTSVAPVRERYLAKLSLESFRIPVMSTGEEVRFSLTPRVTSSSMPLSRGEVSVGETLHIQA
jgi:hypothetical protein